MSQDLDTEVHCDIEDDGSIDGQPVHYASLHSRADVLAALPSRQTIAALDAAYGDGPTLRRTRSRRDRHYVSAVQLGPDTPDGTVTDTPTEEDTLGRLSKVRSLTSNITVKRRARTRLLATPRAKLTGFQKWKYDFEKDWQKTKVGFKEFTDYFTIWKSSFKTIEGKFGSSVMSYFHFMKWLFLLNIFTACCILSSILLPQLLLQPSSFNETIYPLNQSAPIPEYQEQAIECSESYGHYIKAHTRLNADSLAVDIFQGMGIIENTYAFMGYYYNKTIFSEDKTYYNTPLAYLLATAGYLFITLILMVRYTAKGVKTKLLSKGQKFHKVTFLVFCGWDYTLNHEIARDYKHLSLEHELTSELEAQRRAESKAKMSAKRKFFIFFKRIIINIVCIACLVGAATLIYFVVEVWKPMFLTWDQVLDSDVLMLCVEYLPSATITGLNFVMPFIFNRLTPLEEYSPAIELRFSIARISFLRLASLVILAFTMLRLIDCDDEVMVCGTCKNIKCWETYVGQELYKLVVMDFVVIFVMTFLVEFPRKFIVTRVKLLKRFHQEFDLPKNVLAIVYTQTLSWWGGFYSPVIPGLTVVKLFIVFYCKKLSLIKNQKPPNRPYRTSRSNHFFMVILMVAYTSSVLAIVYTVGRVTPSQGCSPFRVHNNPNFKMFHVVTMAVETLPVMARNFFFFLTSWICYVVSFFVLALTIYYQSARAASSKKMVELLEDHLTLLEKDKQFLLGQVNTAIQN